MLALKKRKIPFPQRKLNPDVSVSQPAVSKLLEKFTEKG
jgi:hypothetical protein